MALQSRKH